MKIDRKTLAARSWAIPAISGCLVLHHDFKSPRLAKVHRLAWSESSVEVYLQYGICNLSGNVIDSTDMVVILHQDGAVGIRSLFAAADNSHLALLTFLAGEVHRESFRWTEDMRLWEQGEKLDSDRAAILAIVSALVAHPSLDMNVEVDKDALNPAGIRKARLLSQSSVIEITPAGLHGVNFYVKGSGTHTGALRLYQEVDLRQPDAQAKTPSARFLKGASLSARQLMLLPMGAVQYWCRKKQRSDMKQASDLVAYLPMSVVDAHAGDSLSALSN